MTAERWLARLGGEVVRGADITLLRRMVLTAAVALVTIPLGLTALLRPVLALPVGAAVVVAVFLIISVIAFSRPRSLPQMVVSDDIYFDTCPGLMLSLDAQGQVLRVGGRDAQSFPSAIRDCAGVTLAERVHVSDQIALLQAFDMLRQGASRAETDVRVQKTSSVADGRQFILVRFDFTAIRNGEGNLVQVIAQARDVSEYDALRREAESRQEEARSAHETKSRFLAAVSHELRTPLNAILGFSDVLAGEYFGKLANDRQREYVGLIRQSGGHLLSVVTTMLDMSKIEAGRYELLIEPFAASEAVETCRAMLDLQARDKGITLTARVSRALPEVLADRRALQQILINLAGNAIKFTDRGGVVSMDASLRGQDLVITVSDTGIGIAAEKLGTLGQPFTQVDNSYNRNYEGTGLGLALVKGLVALHRGTFAIASRPGEGTVVTITLPMGGPDTADAEDAMVETVEFPPRLKTVQLKNSDEKAMMEGTAMERSGIQLGCANDHAEAKIA
nr:HAMP domain-containing sensor histidine kinase [Rhizobium smilacinae]